MINCNYKNEGFCILEVISILAEGTVKKLDLLTFVINGIAWIVSTFRICTGRAEAFDYIVVFFSFSILAYDIYKIIKILAEKRDNQKNNQENGTKCQ